MSVYIFHNELVCAKAHTEKARQIAVEKIDFESIPFVYLCDTKLRTKSTRALDKNQEI
jgi:hypothetical protein